MEQAYKLKYGNFFGDLTKFKDTLGLSLKIYLKIYSIANIQTELIPLICQVKNKRTRSSRVISPNG